MFKNTIVVVAVSALLSCANFPPSLVPPILCGFAKVIVSQTDIPEIEKAFGTDKSPGSRLCTAIGILLTGDSSGASLPSVVDTPRKLDLPTGEDNFVTITVAPPTD